MTYPSHSFRSRMEPGEAGNADDEFVDGCVSRRRPGPDDPQCRETHIQDAAPSSVGRSVAGASARSRASRWRWRTRRARVRPAWAGSPCTPTGRSGRRCRRARSAAPIDWRALETSAGGRRSPCAAVPKSHPRGGGPGPRGRPGRRPPVPPTGRGPGASGRSRYPLCPGSPRWARTPRAPVRRHPGQPDTDHETRDTPAAARRANPGPRSPAMYGGSGSSCPGREDHGLLLAPPGEGRPMRPGMCSMVTLSFDSSLYAAFFPALSGKTAGSPAPGPVCHFRPMATILSRTRPSGWGGRGYSRCAQSVLSSACSATGGAGGRSGSRQRVPRHLSSRGSSHTRPRGRTSRRLARGAAVAAPPAGGPTRQPSCPGSVQVQAITGRTRWRTRQCSATHPAARGGGADAGPCTRTPGSNRKRWLRISFGRFSARASAARPMARSRAARVQPAAGRQRPPSLPWADDTIQYRSRPPGGRAQPCGWWQAIIASRRRRSPSPDTGSRRTAPGDASGPSTDMSGKSAAGIRHFRREPDGARAAYRPGPSLSAIPRTARRPAERTGSLRAFRQPSCSTGPAPANGGRVTVPALICRRPTCIGPTQAVRIPRITVDLRLCEKIRQARMCKPENPRLSVSVAPTGRSTGDGSHPGCAGHINGPVTGAGRPEQPSPPRARCSEAQGSVRRGAGGVPVETRRGGGARSRLIRTKARPRPGAQRHVRAGGAAFAGKGRGPSAVRFRAPQGAFSPLRKRPLRSLHNICYWLVPTERRPPVPGDAVRSSVGGVIQVQQEPKKHDNLSTESRVRSAEIIFEVTEAIEGGYNARALGYSIYTQGENWDDLKEMARDAVLCHFGEDEAPNIVRLHLVQEETIAV